MRFARAVPILLIAVVGLVSCSRDPNVAKRRYLESGNKYFDKGKYKEARIMYKDALQKDQRFGQAYYKLGLTELKLNNVSGAVMAFRRAIELLGQDNPDRWDAVVKTSEIYLAAGREKQFLDEVDGFCKELLKRDPNSYDGHRLTGDLVFARAIQAFNTGQRDEGNQLLDTALAEYQKANTIKPGQEGVMLQMARALAGKGDRAGSAQHYRQVLDANKNSQFAYEELYRLYLYQPEPQWQEAEDILKLACRNNPKQFGYWRMLALHYSMQKRTDDMLKVLEQIKAQAKEFPDAYLLVGDFYLQLGNADAAIREYRDGLAKDPKRTTTYQKRVMEAMLRQGKKDEVAKLNQEVLKEDPNDPDARGLAATFLLDKGEVTRAMNELQAVVTRAPDNVAARYNLGQTHLARGEWEQARQMFQKAIEIRPDFILARIALGKLQLDLGEFDAAVKTARALLDIDHGNPNGRLIESAALIGEKKFPEARLQLEAMLKTDPASTDVHYQLAVIDLAEKKYKDADEEFRKSYQLNPANARGLLGVVESDLAQNKADDAIQLLRTETDKTPNRLDFRGALANTAARAGKYDLAVAEYTKVLGALDKNPRAQGEVYLRVGEVYRHKGDDANAIVNLQKAREAQPENPMILSTLALTFDHAGRWNEARQVYEAVLRLDPNNFVSLNNLAYLIAEHGGDLDDALTKAQKAKQLMPNLVEVSDTLGWIYLKKNLSDSAIDIFKDLVAKRPAQATYRYHLGMALSQKGDKPRAIQELKEALKYNPAQGDRDKIQQLLNKLTGA